MINDTHNSQSVQKNWYVFGKKPKKNKGNTSRNTLLILPNISDFSCNGFIQILYKFYINFIYLLSIVFNYGLGIGKRNLKLLHRSFIG